jgi:hypothetical protein
LQVKSSAGLLQRIHDVKYGCRFQIKDKIPIDRFLLKIGVLLKSTIADVNADSHEYAIRNAVVFPFAKI